MSKAIGNLFGSKSSSVVSGTTPTGFGSLPDFGQAAFKTGVANATNLAQDSSIFAPAPINADQQASFDLARQGYQDVTPDSFNAGVQMFSNPFEQQVIDTQNAEIRRQGMGLFNDIGAGATSAGAFGGARQAITESETARNILDQIASSNASLRSGNYQSAADRSIANIGQMNQNKQQTQADLGAIGDFMQQQAFAQQQAPIQANNYLLQAAQGLPTGGGGVSYGQRENPGFLKRLGDSSQGIAAIGQAAAMMSDLRLKENVKPLGEENGFPVYEFNYIGKLQRYIGVMAQDVLKRQPEAVLTYPDGMMAVYYDKIGVTMREAH